ncbi:MAG: hypothetical protein IKH58_01980 [Bacteroidales bacterium]|nr:hypothetical protein [Bacteroidales bacterium]
MRQREDVRCGSLEDMQRRENVLYGLLEGMRQQEDVRCGSLKDMRR